MPVQLPTSLSTVVFVFEQLHLTLFHRAMLCSQTLFEGSTMFKTVEWQECEGITMFCFVGDEMWRGGQDSTIKVHEASSGDKITVLMPYDGGEITDMSSDGQHVWVAHANQEIRVLAKDTRASVKTLFAAQSPPIVLARPRSRVPGVWSCAEDGSVIVWNSLRCVADKVPTYLEQLQARADEYSRPASAKLRAVTWSVPKLGQLTQLNWRFSVRFFSAKPRYGLCGHTWACYSSHRCGSLLSAGM